MRGSSKRVEGTDGGSGVKKAGPTPAEKDGLKRVQDEHARSRPASG